jgi:hypothetical protein
MANDIKASSVEVVDAAEKVVLQLTKESNALIYDNGILKTNVHAGVMYLGPNLGSANSKEELFNATIVLDGLEQSGSCGYIRAGGQGKAGRIQLYDMHNNVSITIDGEKGSIDASGLGSAHTLQANVIQAKVITLAAGGAVVTIGGPDGTVGCEFVVANKRLTTPLLHVRNRQDTQRIVLDGETQKISCADVELFHADCAEEFDVQQDSTIEPGSVVILTDEGAVTTCSEEYDTRVAGVVSGAGAYKPGIVLDRRSASSRRVPVTLMGKVVCKVDATNAPVRPGDILVSSPLAGHAMKARDRDRLAGAVLGKALESMSRGIGLLPMLVALG